MYLIISASPNKDGLTAACSNAALKGITKAGGKAEIVDISEMKLEPCRICNDGWGTCYPQARCVIDDPLAKIQDDIRKADGLILVSPVYFCQPSERMKYFFDRFRRCEAFNKDGSAAKDKPVISVAAAGGSGAGPETCLDEMRLWCWCVYANPETRIGITQKNRAEALVEIEDAAYALCTRLRSGQ